MGALLDSLSEKEEISPLAHVAAKFVSGALAGLPEAAARRFGKEEVFEAGGMTGVAGTVADLAGFAVGASQKAIGLALRGAKAISTTGKVVEQAARLGGLGAIYGGAQAVVGGEDVVERALSEAPVWAAFGGAGPLLSSFGQRIFPKVPKEIEAVTGLGEEVPKFILTEEGPLIKAGRPTTKLLTYTPSSPLPPLRKRFRVEEVSTTGVKLFDSFSRPVQVKNFLTKAAEAVSGGVGERRIFLTATELLAKRRSNESVSILFDQAGRAVGAVPSASVVYERPTFTPPRSKLTQAELVRERLREAETWKARLFPSRPLGAKLARAKISGKAEEVQAVASEIRHTQEVEALVDEVKASGRLPGHIQLSKINPSQLYDLSIMSAEDIPMTMTVKGSILKGVLGDKRVRILDVKPKAEPAGFADVDLLGEGYRSLGPRSVGAAAAEEFPIKSIEHAKRLTDKAAQTNIVRIKLLEDLSEVQVKANLTKLRFARKSGDIETVNHYQLGQLKWQGVKYEVLK